MSIQTNETVNIMYGQTIVDTYGLSKTLDNYTMDEIKDYLYCSFTNKLIRGFMGKIDNASIQDYNDILPFSATPKETAGVFEINVNDNSRLPLPNGAYCFVVWLKTIQTRLEVINSSLSEYKLVTEMPANKLKYILPNPTGEKDNITSWLNGDGSGCYATGSNAGTLNYVYNLEDIELSDIQPYFIILYNDTVFFWRFTQNEMTFYTRPNDHGIYGEKYVGGIAMYDITRTAYSVIGAKIRTLDIEGDLPYEWSTGSGASTSVNPASWGTCDDDCIWYAQGGGNQADVFGTMRFWWYLNTKHQSLLFWAGIGVKFYADKLYKPIIEGGYVTGYTDNMVTPSELDTWTGTTKHDVNPTPPAPSAPTGDKEIDMPLAYIGGTAGMVDFIKINASGLASADDIADAISRFDITTIGKDLLRNFVAFKCYAVLNIDDSVVRDIKVAGHTLKDENDHALQGEYIGAIEPVDFSAGRIEPMYNDYRDFAPYTRIQMYVPFCGWFDLPSWCMGKEITGTMFTDLYNGTVKAVIYASRTVVAEVGGCCAFDIPFAAESTGMKAGAVISSALSTIAMTGATIAAPNIATGIAAVSSAANFISAANSNGTTLKGVMGDGSNTNGLLHVYIKTTRPNSPDGNKEIPDRYKHENGIPCFKQLTLTAGDGYTQILDANIEGNMTDREKQMIIDGFRHGLIL